MNKYFIENTHFNHSMLVFDSIEHRHGGVNLHCLHSIKVSTLLSILYVCSTL